MYSTLQKNQLACACALTFIGLGIDLAAPQARAADDLSTSPYLFGDWNGERTRLADEGVHFDLEYGGEAAQNFAGGTYDVVSPPAASHPLCLHFLFAKAANFHDAHRCCRQHQYGSGYAGSALSRAW